MNVVEVTDPERVDRLVAFDLSIASEWICDHYAVRQSNRPEVRASNLTAWVLRDQTTVAAAVEGDDPSRERDLLGFIVVDDDQDGRGGCRGRWVAVDERVPEVLQGLFDFCSDRYGWIWGRLTNPRLQETVRTFECVPLPDDPSVFTYRRP